MDPAINHFQILVQLEESLWRADTRGDRVMMDCTFAGDIIEFGWSGRIWARDDLLWDGCPPIDVRLPLPDFNVCLIDGRTALVTYNSIVESREAIQYARRCSIWLFQDDRWKLRFHQGTPYEPDAGTED